MKQGLYLNFESNTLIKKVIYLQENKINKYRPMQRYPKAPKFGFGAKNHLESV